MQVLVCRDIDGARTMIPLDRVDSVARSPYKGKNVVVTTKSGQEYHVERDWRIVEFEDWSKVLDGIFEQQRERKEDGDKDTKGKSERPEGDGAVPPVPAGRQGQRHSNH